MHRFRRRISSCQLGEDGLVPVRSPVQERLDQIMEEYKVSLNVFDSLQSLRYFMLGVVMVWVFIKKPFYLAEVNHF